MIIRRQPSLQMKALSCSGALGFLQLVLACLGLCYNRACLHITHCLLWCLVQRESSTTASQEDANLWSAHNIIPIVCEHKF